MNLKSFLHPWAVLKTSSWREANSAYRISDCGSALLSHALIYLPTLPLPPLPCLCPQICLVAQNFICTTSSSFFSLVSCLSACPQCRTVHSHLFWVCRPSFFTCFVHNPTCSFPLFFFLLLLSFRFLEAQPFQICSWPFPHTDIQGRD